MHGKLPIITDGSRPVPKEGIPKQWVPCWIRWPLRIFVYPFMMTDFIAYKLIRRLIKPPYQLKGKCQQTGKCCHYIHMDWPQKGKIATFFSYIRLFWNTQFLGFYFRSFALMEEKDYETRVMSCRYLQKDGSCKHYRLRPLVCRLWPRQSYFMRPSLFKGCGYRVENRKKSK